MTEPLCVICGEDRDYSDHAGGELRHKFEPEPLTEEQLAYGRDVVGMRIRAEKAEADAKLAWRRVTELQERGTQLVEERRAAEERSADALLRKVKAWRQSFDDQFSEHAWQELESVLSDFEVGP